MKLFIAMAALLALVAGALILGGVGQSLGWPWPVGLAVLVAMVMIRLALEKL